MNSNEVVKKLVNVIIDVVFSEIVEPIKDYELVNKTKILNEIVIIDTKEIDVIMV